MTVAQAQVAPPVGCRRRGCDSLAAKDTMHLADLGKGKKAIVFQMLKEMLLSGKPEAPFNIEQFVF